MEIFLVVAIVLIGDPNAYSTQIREPSTEICMARAKQAFDALSNLQALGYDGMSVSCISKMSPPA
jgi:hypothetical protein